MRDGQSEVVNPRVLGAAERRKTRIWNLLFGWCLPSQVVVVAFLCRLV
jgi:hypothetical protein